MSLWLSTPCSARPHPAYARCFSLVLNSPSFAGSYEPPYSISHIPWTLLGLQVLPAMMASGNQSPACLLHASFVSPQP